MQTSKSDCADTFHLQRNVLVAACVDPAQLYEDLAVGKRGDCSDLDAYLKELRIGDTLVVWMRDRRGPLNNMVHFCLVTV